MRRSIGFVIAALLTGLPTSSARADDVTHLTWQELVQRARDAAAHGEPREALAWAQKAAAIHLPPSLRVFMLEPQRAVGDSAAAYANAKMCVTEAESDPNVPLREKVLSACRDAVSVLKPAIAELNISLPSPLPPDVKVLVNGNEVLPALLALPFPVNPGHVVLDITAPGYLPFHRELTVEASANTSVAATLVREPPKCADGEILGADQQSCISVCVGGKVRASDARHCCWSGQSWSTETGACSGTPICPSGLVPEQGTCAVAEPSPVPPSPPRRVESRRSVAPLFVAGAGAAVVVGGTIAWVVSSSKYSTLQNDCGGNNQCLPNRFASDTSGIGTLDALGVLGWTVGGAALVGGGLWYLFSSPTSSQGSAEIHFQLRPLGHGAAVVGTF